MNARRVSFITAMASAWAILVSGVALAIYCLVDSFLVWQRFGLVLANRLYLPFAAVLILAAAALLMWGATHMTTGVTPSAAQRVDAPQTSKYETRVYLPGDVGYSEALDRLKTTEEQNTHDS